MKKNLTKIGLCIMVLFIIMAMTTMVFATNGWDVNLSGGTSQGTEIQTKVNTVGGYFLWVAQMLGYGVATIMLAVLAIKYLLASPNERADIKKSATIWIVGAILLFAGSGIITMIRSFSGVFNSNTGAGNPSSQGSVVGPGRKNRYARVIGI